MKKFWASSLFIAFVALSGFSACPGKFNAAEHILSTLEKLKVYQTDSADKCWDIIINVKNPPRVLPVPPDSIPMYFPEDDIILMPEATPDTSEEEYIMTIFHELAHSTKHVTRLNRNLPRYAEEVVAEMIAVSLAQKCNLNDSKWGRSFTYIEGWLATLQTDDLKFSITEYLQHVAIGTDYLVNRK